MPVSIATCCPQILSLELENVNLSEHTSCCYSVHCLLKVGGGYSGEEMIWYLGVCLRLVLVTAAVVRELISLC